MDIVWNPSVVVGETDEAPKPKARKVRHRIRDTDELELTGSPDASCESKPTQKLRDGCLYKGTWKMNKRHGRGIQLWPDDTYFTGEWFNDDANGRGRLIKPDGSMYEGNFVDNKRHGDGNFYSSDGAEYRGRWINDK